MLNGMVTWQAEKGIRTTGSLFSKSESLKRGNRGCARSRDLSDMTRWSCIWSVVWTNEL